MYRQPRRDVNIHTSHSINRKRHIQTYSIYQINPRITLLGKENLCFYDASGTVSWNRRGIYSSTAAASQEQYQVACVFRGAEKDHIDRYSKITLLQLIVDARLNCLETITQCELANSHWLVGNNLKEAIMEELSRDITNNYPRPLVIYNR